MRAAGMLLFYLAGVALWWFFAAAMWACLPAWDFIPRAFCAIAAATGGLALAGLAVIIAIGLFALLAERLAGAKD